MCVRVCMRACVCVYGLLIGFRMFCSIFVDHIPHWRQQLEERASSTSALLHCSSHCIGCVHLVHLSCAVQCSSLIHLTPTPPHRRVTRPRRPGCRCSIKPCRYIVNRNRGVCCHVHCTHVSVAAFTPTPPFPLIESHGLCLDLSVYAACSICECVCCMQHLRVCMLHAACAAAVVPARVSAHLRFICRRGLSFDDVLSWILGGQR